MNATILGMGWITPAGRELAAVQDAILSGAAPPALSILEGPGTTPLQVLRVQPDQTSDSDAFPRLRRSGSISHFAVSAAADAAESLTPDQLARTALVFASSDGGVAYTRRFFGDVVERNPGAGSPLLFPETVYNAPASHIAARLGLVGESLTLVGDVEVGIDAVQVGLELLACGEADYCLVAAAQELDWITAEAYGRWGLTGPERGAVLSEGAAAIVLGRDGPGCRITQISSGRHRRQNPDAYARIAAEFPQSPDFIVSSHSGTRPGLAEHQALQKLFPSQPIATPKTLLGEALGCSSLQQVVCAALAVEKHGFSTSVTYATGFTGRISALYLTENPRHA